MKFSFHIWNCNIFKCETANSRVKWSDLEFHMWNFGVRDMHLTCEMEDLHTIFNITIRVWNIIFILCEITCEIFPRELHTIVKDFFAKNVTYN